MKYFLFLLLTFSLFAQDFPSLHYSSSFESAIKKAKKEKKMVMLFITQDYCPWCKKLAYKILSDASISSLIKEKFIPVILNKNRDNIPLKYQTPIAPTLFFINAQENEEIWRQSGYCDRTKLSEVFEKAFKSLQEDLEDEID